YPCYQEGFYRDQDHCGRFYRCAPVRNRPGVFTLYTFGCPEGTAFDEYQRICLAPHSEDPCFNQVARAPEPPRRRVNYPAPVRSSFRDGHPLPCRGDGFHSHPYDCNRFYRCVRYEQDSFYNVYEFNCPESLVFDDYSGTCNYPEMSYSDQSGGHQQGSSQQSNQESQQSGGGQSSTHSGSTTETRPPSQGAQQGPADQPPCTREGFFAHPDDCNKFYRCVSGDTGSYVVYVFNCGATLVWDEVEETCNYPHAVSGPCAGRPGQPPPEEGTTEPCDKDEQGAPGGRPGEGMPGGGRPGGSSPGGGSPSSQDLPCPNEGFFRNPSNCHRFYRCVKRDNSGGGGGGDGKEYDVYEFNCPEGLVFDERFSVCNWPHQAAPCDESPTEGSSPSRPSPAEDGRDQEPTKPPCKGEGFFRHPDSCYRFYRCVNSGSSANNFVVYEFNCPEGLVFDERYSTCNWPSDAPPCDSLMPPSGGQAPSRPGGRPGGPGQARTTGATGTARSTRTTGARRTTRTRWTTRGPRRKTRSTRTSHLPCTNEGFFRNPDNCYRFYRCVDTGSGYVAYEFNCPEGLVFDERFSTCNWPDAAPPCDQKAPLEKPAPGGQPGGGKPGPGKPGPGKPGTDSTGTTPAGSTAKDTTGTTSAGTDSTGSTGTGSTATPPTGTDSTGTTETTTDGTTEKDCDKTTTKQPPSGGGRPAAVKEPNGKASELSCPRTGFFRRPGNCNKFYRCVDFYMTGRNYVVYEFDCPEGLVFDERYSVCNWPEQADPCEEGPPPQGQAPPGSDGGAQGGPPGTLLNPSTVERQPGQPGQPGGQGRPGGPGEPGVAPPATDVTSPKQPSTPESTGLPCPSQGFFRNPQDCHRFYRCVDLSENGKGFVVYEFDCPAGLVFDERVSVCNWPEDAPPCDGGRDGPSTGGAPPAEQGQTPSQPPTGGDTPSYPPTEGETPSSPPAGGDTPVYPPTEGETPSSPPTGGETPSYPPAEGEQPSPPSSPEEPAADAPQPPGDCEPKCSRTGYFRNPGDCNKFYRCVDFYQNAQYVIFHFDCPAGLVFDERYSVCNWPHDAPPCDSSGGEGGAGSCAPSRRPSPPSRPSQQEPGPQPQPQPRPPQPPPKPADSSVCKQTGFIRDPADCHKFYRCVDPWQNGKLQAHHFDCPAGLVFDERYSVCNWAHDAPPCDAQ
ncbi:unnamed protein product, partial [Ixodes hexagonus]